MNHPPEISELAEIIDYPDNPVEFFKNLRFYTPHNMMTMNLATLDSEFGVLNRTVICRGIAEDGVIYATQRYTRNCQNVQDSGKASVTFYFPELSFPEQGLGDGGLTTWQVRLFDCDIVELPQHKLDELWQEEPLYAKIRAYICKCGEPTDHKSLQKAHDEMYNNYLANQTKQLERPDTYIAFKFVPKRWDFYKTAEYAIADRIQYRKQSNGQWKALHIAT